MDPLKSMQNYVTKMVSDVKGMKLLLLDVETTPIVSVVMTQSQLLSKEAYLVDKIEKKDRDRMKHMKCICFLRPTPESIQAMVDELRNPLYGQYFLYFSNILKKSQIERLAEMDEFEVVKSVNEYYGDFMAIHSDLFTLNLKHPHQPLYGDSPSIWHGHTFQRVVEGVLSLLLALKRRPLIRYEKNSALAKRLGTELHYQMQQENDLFNFRRPDTPPILLLLDRKNDPVTPLLSQWTYEAMVHELLEIRNGRVSLAQVADVREELKELVLSADQDSFYHRNMHLNLGDLGANIKQYVDEYQSKTQSNMKIDSITEMKRFVEEYPEFRKLSGNVGKHVALVGELSRCVDRGKLLVVGELEQNLACLEQHAQDYKTLLSILNDSAVSTNSKLRLVILYAFRYEKSSQNSLPTVMDALRSGGCSEQELACVQIMLNYAGSDQRLEDLFSNTSILSKGKNVLRGLQGVENVYTQHTVHLAQTLDAMLKGKLKDPLYAFVDGAPSKDRPQEIIVFMIGGCTYSESRTVALFNQQNPGVRVILGGTTIHNSASYLHECVESSRRWTFRT